MPCRITARGARLLGAGSALLGRAPGTWRPIAAVVVVLSALGAVEPPSPFNVGVLRRDGVVVPFAAWNGKRWGAYWPRPGLELTVPITLQSVPKAWWGPNRALDTWQAWTAGEPRALRVTQPDWVDVHCVRQIGLRTDYHAERPAPPRTEQPYPKDGLVVSPPQPVDRVEIVSPGAPDVRSFLTELREAFNRAERVVESNHGHPIARRAREGIEPTVEAVYAFGDASRVYYVEASRAYRPIGEVNCDSTAFGTGWFVRENGSVRPLAMAVDLLRCDKYGASYMLPLGVMRLGMRVFWLVQFSGWNHERFAVVEIKSKTVEAVVNVWGGGC